MTSAFAGAMSQGAVPGAGAKTCASSISKSKTSGSGATESPRVLVWCSARAGSGIGAVFVFAASVANVAVTEGTLTISRSRFLEATHS